MTYAKTCTIRDVHIRDLPALALIEQERWTREKTAILSLAKIEEWYESRSPFFLVAEKNGSIVGFYYGIQVNFSMDRIDEFTSADARKEEGYTIHTHDASAKSVYGINVVTVAPEAGIELNAEVHARLEQMKAEYFVGFTRLVHLDHYLKGVEAAHEGKLPYEESEIALWYAHQTMKMIGARTWKEGSAEPALILPPLRRPDTILRFHVEGTNLGLLRVVDHYMEDPKSRNYGAFIASELPHMRRSD